MGAESQGGGAGQAVESAAQAGQAAGGKHLGQGSALGIGAGTACAAWHGGHDGQSAADNLDDDDDGPTRALLPSTAAPPDVPRAPPTKVRSNTITTTTPQQANTQRFMPPLILLPPPAPPPLLPSLPRSCSLRGITTTCVVLRAPTNRKLAQVAVDQFEVFVLSVQVVPVCMHASNDLYFAGRLSAETSQALQTTPRQPRNHSTPPSKSWQ